MTLGFPDGKCEVAENDEYAIIHLRIEGKFFVPITATVTCFSGSAKG